TRVPMAVTIIGGLVTSTVLTLVVVPVVYSLLDALRNRVMRRAGRPLPAAEPTAAAGHAPAADSAAALREAAERARERAAS
ncbi:MAG TPA: hypothetical protein VEP68_04460, partial [Anaeromyxobacteraceae bacterium]|nr:hypothetical protein [Anaeromyxobacteraceae bacterium]